MTQNSNMIRHPLSILIVVSLWAAMGCGAGLVGGDTDEETGSGSRERQTAFNHHHESFHSIQWSWSTAPSTWTVPLAGGTREVRVTLTHEHATETARVVVRASPPSPTGADRFEVRIGTHGGVETFTSMLAVGETFGGGPPQLIMESWHENAGAPPQWGVGGWARFRLEVWEIEQGNSFGAPGAYGGYGSCTSGGQTGTCQSTSIPCPGGYVSGLCPGPSDIKCCLPSVGGCTSGGQTGTCQSTSVPCAGGYVSGLCPGPSDIKCCLLSAFGASPPGSCHGRGCHFDPSASCQCDTACSQPDHDDCCHDRHEVCP